jgi:hypothetical protein
MCCILFPVNYSRDEEMKCKQAVVISVKAGSYSPVVMAKEAEHGEPSRGETDIAITLLSMTVDKTNQQAYTVSRL